MIEHFCPFIQVLPAEGYYCSEFYLINFHWQLSLVKSELGQNQLEHDLADFIVKFWDSH